MLRSCAACFVVIAGLVLSGCTVEDKFKAEYLQPDTNWVADPADLGLTAIAADIPVSGASVHGLLIPAPAADGRTVVLFHGSGTNVSQLHPYYSFLHDAGFNVFAFDYRGFGQSQGEASLHGIVNDMPDVLDWLRQRPEVDAGKIAFYGFGIGATVALRSAAHLLDVRALVLEDLISVRDHVHDASERDKGSLTAAMVTGIAEFSTIPEGLEPDDNAAGLRVPAFFLGGSDSLRGDLFAMLRTWLAYKGDKQLWVIPGTETAPEPLAVQDGQYQRAVIGFLQSAFAGAAEVVTADWRVVESGKDKVWCEVTVNRRAPDSEPPWAIEVCGLDADGKATFHHVWLDGAKAAFRLGFAKAPAAVAAMRCFDAVGTEDGGWQPAPNAMAASARAYALLIDDVELLRHGQPDAARVAQIAAGIERQRAAHPFDPRLDAEFADAYYEIGRRLLQSPDAVDVEAGRRWLQLAVDSAPAQPRLHYWPGRHPTFGYPQQAAVDAARALLSQAPK